jgi:hypothetical protein
MWLRTAFIVALAAAGVWQGYNRWQLRPVHPADGPIAPDDPLQADADGASPTALGRWRLTPRALRHHGTNPRARGLSLRSAFRLIPEDLALGWGPMSDNKVIRAFDISQSVRFYSWMPKQALPIPRQAVIEHSANTHVIPADAGVARQLERVRIGQVVHLRGYLVNAVRDDGVYITTSMTRSDSGPGSCEVLLVEQVETF